MCSVLQNCDYYLLPHVVWVTRPSEFTTFLAMRKVEFMSWQFMENYLPLIYAKRIGLSIQRDLVFISLPMALPPMPRNVSFF